jgi:hypothetical protein
VIVLFRGGVASLFFTSFSFHVPSTTSVENRFLVLSFNKNSFYRVTMIFLISSEREKKERKKEEEEKRSPTTTTTATTTTASETRSISLYLSLSPPSPPILFNYSSAFFKSTRI